MSDDPILDRLDELATTYRDGLLHDTLPFWLPRAVDRAQGGFQTCRDRDGSLLDSDKGMWQQGRCSWLLGELYNQVEARPEWLELCRHGIAFIEQHGFDPADGRMWFHVAADGRPIRKRRYAFSESFASIAFGELALATGESRWADRAEATFRRFVEHQPEPKYTGTRPTVGLGLPMITIVTCQELRQSIGLAQADAWIDRSIAQIEDLHVKPEHGAVMEQVAPDGQILDHFDGRMLNPGHAIEGAWFIMQEGEYRSDASLIELGCKMLDWTFPRGWDQEFGGLLYFVDLDCKPVTEYWHDMKFWWPHNETILATLLAYKLTQQPRYARWHQQIHDWSYAHFPDPEHGEWFGYLRRDGQVSSHLKGNLWKGPFHLPRMQLLAWQMVEAIRQRSRSAKRK